MTATITNPLDGTHETLTADVSNTLITSSLVGNVLTLSGVADRATYEKVLKTISYSNTANSPQSGERKIEVVVNDGVVDSTPATASVNVGSTAPLAPAVDAVFQKISDWLWS